ncbi:hypothetical protein ASPWEDRAFT_176406 [Aspergillus wentii DTO 134E9]|uniref:Uncharacterized protein n=1 Tax=Aspergillus wentii DTO 134E9 TaxID=1073089 RepID=A0A1L9R8T3_ASPWE|nr:uncharacterized protein ASPWEDRAFT_176406 [Aspergillus wentii DTO 134E9]OJJ31326.1 hypothetical protein ASPWEDRAFT_176406 [Aspergillus wentii DTO 134E9]
MSDTSSHVFGEITIVQVPSRKPRRNEQPLSVISPGLSDDRSGYHMFFPSLPPTPGTQRTSQTYLFPQSPLIVLVPREVTYTHRLPRRSSVVFFDLPGTFQTGTDLVRYLYGQSEHNGGEIGDESTVRNSLSVGIHVAGFFPKRGTIYAAAKANIMLIQKLFEQGRLVFRYPLVAS